MSVLRRWLFRVAFSSLILAVPAGLRAEVPCDTADFEDGSLGDWIEDDNNDSSTAAAGGHMVGTYEGGGLWMSAVWYRSPAGDPTYISGDMTYQADIQVSGLMANPNLGPRTHVGLNMFSDLGAQYGLQIIHDDPSFAMSGESQWIVALSDFNFGYAWPDWIAVPGDADWLTLKAERVGENIAFSVSFDGGAFQEFASRTDDNPMLLAAMYGYLCADLSFSSPPSGQEIVMDNLVVCAGGVAEEGEPGGEGERQGCAQLFGSYSTFSNGSFGDWTPYNIVTDADITVGGGKLLGKISPGTGACDSVLFKQNNVTGDFSIEGSVDLADFKKNAGIGSWSNMGLNVWAGGGDELNHALVVYREGPIDVWNVTGAPVDTWLALAWDSDWNVTGFLAIPDDTETVTLRIMRRDDLILHLADFHNGDGFLLVAFEEVPGWVQLEGMYGWGNGGVDLWDAAPVGGKTVAMDNFLVTGDSVCDFGYGHPGVPAAGFAGLFLLTSSMALLYARGLRKRER